MKKLVELSVEGAKILDICIEGDKLIEQGTSGVYNKSVKGVKIQKGTFALFSSLQNFWSSSNAPSCVSWLTPLFCA